MSTFRTLRRTTLQSQLNLDDENRNHNNKNDHNQSQVNISNVENMKDVQNTENAEHTAETFLNEFNNNVVKHNLNPDSNSENDDEPTEHSQPANVSKSLKELIISETCSCLQIAREHDLQILIKIRNDQKYASDSESDSDKIFYILKCLESLITSNKLVWPCKLHLTALKDLLKLQSALLEKLIKCLYIYFVKKTKDMTELCKNAHTFFWFVNGEKQQKFRNVVHLYWFCVDKINQKLMINKSVILTDLCLWLEINTLDLTTLLKKNEFVNFFKILSWWFVKRKRAESSLIQLVQLEMMMYNYHIHHDKLENDQGWLSMQIHELFQ